MLFVGTARRPRREREFGLEEAIWLISSFCALSRISISPQIFAQRCPPPIPRREFDSAAEEVGLHVEARECSLPVALAWHLPVAVQLITSGEGQAARWAIVLNADETRASLIEQGADAPVVMSVEEVAGRFNGLALALTPQSEELVDTDDVTMRSGRFGLRWFVPELLKHRRIWRDVLITYLVLQLMALATSLFTQVIIDKVVVHRTQSTLIARAVGMALFLVLAGVLTWVRRYLVLHAGQRIDAVLGSNVFNHLFRLPPLYFQHRPTGVIAARPQGIETVREFIASTAVTLALDLPFLPIFVAIMLFYGVSLMLLCLAVLAVISALSLFVAPLFQQRLNEQFRRGAANQAFRTEYLSGIATVKVLQLEPQLNAPTETCSLKPRRAASPGAGRIDVEGLAFRYAGSLPFLFEELNLTIVPGQIMALMRPSGVGKSTLAKLLEGFYAPTRGRIRIDGVDHTHLSTNELRSVFGVVPQETDLFSGTVLDNYCARNLRDQGTPRRLSPASALRPREHK